MKFGKLSKSFTVIIRPLSTLLIKPNFHVTSSKRDLLLKRESAKSDLVTFFTRNYWKTNRGRKQSFKGRSGRIALNVVKNINKITYFAFSLELNIISFPPLVWKRHVFFEVEKFHRLYQNACYKIILLNYTRV